MKERFYRNVRGMILKQEFNRLKWSVESNNLLPDHMDYFKLALTCEGELIAEACVRVVRIIANSATEHVHEWEKRGIIDWLYIPEVFKRIGLEDRILDQIHAVSKFYQLKMLFLTRDKEELEPKKSFGVVLDTKAIKKKGYKVYRTTNEDLTFIKKLKY